MKTKEERDYERERRKQEELIELFEQLTPWNKFEVILYARWLILRQWFKDIPVNWIRFQINLEDDFRELGMPRGLRRQLTKWFNYCPFPGDKYFLWKGKKIWYHTFLEEENFELHLEFKSRSSGHVWLELEKDGVATIIGIHVRDKFRNAGLGTVAFQEAVNQIKHRINRIKGVLEREYYPEPKESIRWLQRQGFQVMQKENGDYEVELRIN